MKKSVRKNKLQSGLKKTLGLLSAGAIAGSLFMGYNRLTGNVISSVEGSSIVSLGGIALFVLGLIGVFLIARE